MIEPASASDRFGGENSGDKELEPPTDEIGEALYAEREPIQQAIEEQRYSDAIELAERLLGKLDVAAKMLPKPGRFFDSGKRMRESIEVLLTYIHYDKVAALKRAGRLVEAYVEIKRLRSNRRKVQGISMAQIDVLENCIWTELAVASKFKKLNLLGLKDTSDLEEINEAHKRLSALTDENKFRDLDRDLQINIRELHKWIQEAYKGATVDVVN